MANETLYLAHLRTYSEDVLLQKFRAEKIYTEYKNAEYRLRNAISDEELVLKSVIANNPNSPRIEIIKKRNEKNEAVRTDTTRYITETSNRITELSNALQAHLQEYSDAQIAAAGFITHTVVTDYKAKNNQDSKLIKFDEPAKAEYGIANSLDKWRDVSKVKITIRKDK